MPQIELAGQIFEVDEDGFIQDITRWNQDVAKAIGIGEGIANITDEHWKVIDYLREYYLKNGIAPMVRRLCKETGFSLKKIYELFPNGPAKGACKLAGLPKPTGCV